MNSTSILNHIDPKREGAARWRHLFALIFLGCLVAVGLFVLGTLVRQMIVTTGPALNLASIQALVAAPELGIKAEQDAVGRYLLTNQASEMPATARVSIVGPDAIGRFLTATQAEKVVHPQVVMDPDALNRYLASGLAVELPASVRIDIVEPDAIGRYLTATQAEKVVHLQGTMDLDAVGRYMAINEVEK